MEHATHMHRHWVTRALPSSSASAGAWRNNLVLRQPAKRGHTQKVMVMMPQTKGHNYFTTAETELRQSAVSLCHHTVSQHDPKSHSTKSYDSGARTPGLQQSKSDSLIS